MRSPAAAGADAHLRAHGARHAERVGGVAVGHQDRELVAPEPRDRVGVAGGGAERLGHAAQGGVPRRMPEQVVDVLEPVHVDDQERERGGTSARGRERPLELLVERPPVGQRGDGILPRLRPERSHEAVDATALGQDRQRREREGQRERTRIDRGLGRWLEHPHHDPLCGGHGAQHQDVAPEIEEARREDDRPQEEELRSGARVAGDEVHRPEHDGGRDGGRRDRPDGNTVGSPEAPDPRSGDDQRDGQRDGQHGPVATEARHGQAEDEAEEAAGREEQPHGPPRADAVAGQDRGGSGGGDLRAVHGAPWHADS